MNLCIYGCGEEAKYQFKNKKWCCSDYSCKCPENRRKNSKSLKRIHRDGNPNITKENLKNKKCEFCENEISAPGLFNHEKFCYLNPNNIKYCKNCNKILKKYNNKYCNYKCSNSHEDNIRRGIKHPNWRGGEDTEYRIICFQYYEKKCIICGFDCTVDVHHIDENKENNSPKNLVPLCPNHHRMSTMNKYKEVILNEIQRACSLIGEASALHVED